MNRLPFFYFALMASVLFCTACGGDEEMPDDDDMMMEEEELTLLSSCVYALTLDGEAFTAEETALNNIVCNVNLSAGGNSMGTTDAMFGGTISDFDTDNGLSIFRGTITREFSQVPGPDPEFEALFTVGTYPITQEADNGFEVFFQDNNGVQWSSTNDNADQSASQLEILEMVSDTIFNQFVLKVRTKFNCNVYNNQGESKACVGTATLGFENF